MAKRQRIPGTRQSRALYLLPSIPDTLDETTKNALAIRNAASTSGVCPSCGATGRLRRRNPGEPANVWHLVFEHEDDCPALLTPRGSS